MFTRKVCLMCCQDEKGECVCLADIPLRGLLNLAILCIVKQKPSYGGEVHQKLRKAFGINTPKPLVYTLLRRMEENGLLTSTWDVEGGGPARRVYRITEEGLEWLREAVKGLEKAIPLIRAILKAFEGG